MYSNPAGTLTSSLCLLWLRVGIRLPESFGWPFLTDALPSYIRDKLQFSHKDLFSFEGLKRAMLKIELQILCTLQGYILRTSRPEPGWAPSFSEGLAILDWVLRKAIKLLTSLTFPSYLKNSSSLLSNILGPDGWLTLAKQQYCLTRGLCMHCG